MFVGSRECGSRWFPRTHGPIRVASRVTSTGELNDLVQYFPDGHERAGIFKGMAVILQERGLGDMSRVCAECPGFKCDPENPRCCCCRILYNQPDFITFYKVFRVSVTAICSPNVSKTKKPAGKSAGSDLYLYKTYFLVLIIMAPFFPLSP